MLGQEVRAVCVLSWCPFIRLPGGGGRSVECMYRLSEVELCIAIFRATKLRRTIFRSDLTGLYSVNGSPCF